MSFKADRRVGTRAAFPSLTCAVTQPAPLDRQRHSLPLSASGAQQSDSAAALHHEQVMVAILRDKTKEKVPPPPQPAGAANQGELIIAVIQG